MSFFFAVLHFSFVLASGVISHLELVCRFFLYNLGLFTFSVYIVWPVLYSKAFSFGVWDSKSIAFEEDIFSERETALWRHCKLYFRTQAVHSRR